MQAALNDELLLALLTLNALISTNWKDIYFYERNYNTFPAFIGEWRADVTQPPFSGLKKHT